MEQIDYEDSIENAIEWIESLAADEYAQLRDMLGDCERGMCCLGVANHILGSNHEASRSYLSSATSRALGLKDTRGTQKTLSRWNDIYGLPFPEIAYKILANPHAIFLEEVADGVVDYFFNRGDV